LWSRKTDSQREEKSDEASGFDKKQPFFFYAEKLKYHHTCMLGLTFFMPLAVVFLAAWLTGSYFSVDAYNWWYIGLYPGLLGVVSSVIGRKDLEKKNHTIWSSPCEMERIWDAKVLVGVMESGTAVFILTVLTIICEKGIEGIFHVSMAAVFSFQTKLAAGVVLWLTTLWQIPFCLLLSQKMGTFVMLLIHIVYDLLNCPRLDPLDCPWIALYTVLINRKGKVPEHPLAKTVLRNHGFNTMYIVPVYTRVGQYIFT